MLGTIQFVKFTGDFEDGCRNLLKVWGLTYIPREKQKMGRSTKQK
jgi:hypothetical protein